MFLWANPQRCRCTLHSSVGCTTLPRLPAAIFQTDAGSVGHGAASATSTGADIMIANSPGNGSSKSVSFYPAIVRARRKPSPRNMQIYEQVRLLGHRQADVAARHGMNQQRVSQIC